MKPAFKNNFLGYFQYYYKIIGNRILFNLGLSIIIGFMDGLGIAMFIPLLQAASTDPNPSNAQVDKAEQSKWIGYIHDAGLELNIPTILGLLVALFVIKGALKFVQLNYQNKIRLIFVRKVRFKLVDTLMNLSYKGFLDLNAGKIQNTLTAEVQRLIQSMMMYLSSAQSAVMLLTYVVLAFIANYQFALFVAVGAGLSNFAYRKIYTSTKKASMALSTQGDKFNSFLIQSIRHFKYLKATNYFGRFSKKLKTVILDTEAVNTKMAFNNAITLSVREPLIIIIVAIVIYIQVEWMGSGMGPIILGLLLLYRSLNFLMIIQNNWQSFMQNMGGMHAVSNIMTEMQDGGEPKVTNELPGFNNSIEIKDVDFYYGDTKIINNLNLTIPKNKTVAFIGESGSGKTTLANIIAALVMPNKGDVLVDGNNLHDYNLNSYRRKIGYISQEPVIFTENIFNNITFWAEKTPENEARFWETVKLASLEDFILSQPDKENASLGDNGLLISGGQKQRISIARELFKESEILILDEATSALDSETEKQIQDNIEKLQGSYTMIIIAHRLSTIKKADTIYLLDKGSVISSGTFDGMLESSERFRRMVELQEIRDAV